MDQYTITIENDKTLYTVRQLMQWNDTLWDKYGYTSRPQGNDFIDLVLEMAVGITSAFKVEELTQEVLDMLENENYHTLCHAIHIVTQLHKYAK